MVDFYGVLWVVVLYYLNRFLYYLNGLYAKVRDKMYDVFFFFLIGYDVLLNGCKNRQNKFLR